MPCLYATAHRVRIANGQCFHLYAHFYWSGNRIERCLSYDEKPLLLFQKLKDAKKNPVFMLKHIKDIRSPIVVAQQKHAARKANSIISNDSTATTATAGHRAVRTGTRPPKLEVNDLAPPSSLNTGLSPQAGWPEPGIASPSVDTQRDEILAAPASATQNHAPMPSIMGLAASTANGLESAKSPEQPLSSGREMPVASSSGVSYAVAIYPYMAEQDDEFDVVV